MPFGKL